MSIKKITTHVLDWYGQNHRDLPWRHTCDPYQILVSEVMLQQTQVDRVIEKYHEFLAAFPTTTVLANASTGDIIRTWKGLGYNRRALFLQKTAKAVEEQYDGGFPQTIEGLKTLPGVGDYTARAVLSFAFQKPVPMMDTNHRRFYQRVFFGLNIKKDKELLEEAEEIIPKKRAYDWNQALMDFGSLICQTQRPKCEICPLKQYCKAYPDILTAVPVKRKKKFAIPFKQTDRYIRGRIIDAIRDAHTVHMDGLFERFKEFDEERVGTIITDLQGEGLIVIVGDFLTFPL